MSKLSEMVKKSVDKFKDLSMGRKIALSVLSFAIVFALIYLALYLNSPKYATLFSNMDPTDAGAVVAKLKEKKVSYKVEGGNTILVPQSQVNNLRLELASEVSLTNGSKGFELIDGKKFATTDEEMKILYQRGLEGELERTIKSFQEVDNARVHLVMPDESAFVKDSTPAQASVTLKLKPGTNLNKEQVKSIVALLTGAVKNLKKENVEIINDKMELLTEGLFDGENAVNGLDGDKQQQLKQKVENELQQKVTTLLNPIYKNKFRVAINTDLDFDIVKKIDTRYEKGPAVSEQTHREQTTSQDGPTSQSPVDNAMTNRTGDNNGSNFSTVDDRTTNYENSKLEQQVIKAPGAIKRITASILLDGNVLDDQTRSTVKNAVIAAIGLDEKRGDTISVEGLRFDNSDEKRAKDALEEMKKLEQKQKTTALIKNISIGVGILVLLFIIILSMKKRKKKEDLVEGGFSKVIDDTIIPKQEEVKYEPINFEQNDEKTHVEKEIKKYAESKPEQVADIVKSWLAEDER